jgi:hypothetical protein
VFAPRVLGQRAAPFAICVIAACALVDGRVTIARADDSPDDGATAHFAETLDVRSFQRGNLHAHSSRSDGGSRPEIVAAWYRDHGYQFAAITDHNILVPPSELAKVETSGFVLIPGEEITSMAHRAPVHVNALCTKKPISGAKYASQSAALTAAVDAIHAQGGVALVNHPNYYWALGTPDLMAIRGQMLLEIWSGHPDVHQDGSATHSSHESKWNDLLSAGYDVAGAAVDDMHVLTPMPGARASAAALPGRGWVETYGADTSRDAICASLAAGHFFASSGVRLARIQVIDSMLTIWVRERGAVVDFIGDHGEVLESQITPRVAQAPADGFPVSYALKGDEKYVRARVEAHVGRAWTQAFRVTRD